MRHRIFFVLVLSVFGCCLGVPECQTNPCKDLWSAKSCNRVKYCIAESWSKLEPTGQTDNVCSICLKMVKEARETLQSNETKEELIQVFDGSCRMLLLKPAVEKCQELVEDFVPELVEILSSQMDPETVCTVARLCNNAEYRKDLKNSKDCLHCEVFTEVAAKRLKSVSLEQFKNGIFDLCRNAGSFSDACFLFGLQYSNTLYTSSKSALENKPCEATLLCPSNSSDFQPGSSLKKKPCSLCMNVMTSLRKELLNVKSAQEFDEKILTVCEKMGFDNGTCSKLTSPSLYEKLNASDKLPHLFCRITFCKENSEQPSAVLSLVPSDNESFSSAKDFNGLEFLEHLEMFFPVKEDVESQPLPPKISYGDPIENPVFFAPNLHLNEFDDCKTCNEMLGILSDSNKSDWHNLKGSLKSLCDKTEDGGLCRIFVENFSPILSRAVEEGFPTSQICEDLMPSCQRPRVALEHEPTKPDNTCNFCINTVRLFKEGDSTVWEQTIEEKCNAVPSEDLRNNCKLIATNALSVLKNSSELETCVSLNLCGSSAIKIENFSYEVGRVNPERSACDTCILTFQTLSDFIKNKHNEYIIRVVLDSLCFMLPPEAFNTCRHFVEVLGISGLEKLIQNINPSEICNALRICQIKEKPLVPPPSEIINSERDGKVPCKFCMMVLKLLLDQLQDNKTEDAIRKALDGVCKYFPEETRDTCKNLIDQYAEDIIDMIIADFNPTEICTYLKICPTRHLLEAANSMRSTVFDVQTNEIKDFNESGEDSTDAPRLREPAVHLLGKPNEENFRRYRKVVQDCALCEALVGVIFSHKKMLSKDYDFSANAYVICYIVPADKRKTCMSMVVSYGPSIVNLLVDQQVDPNEVCVRVDLCDPKLRAKVNEPVSIAEEKIVPEEPVQERNDCVLGPKFWCANAENAEKCGTFLHCQETVWKNWKNPPKRPVKL